MRRLTPCSLLLAGAVALALAAGCGSDEEIPGVVVVPAAGALPKPTAVAPTEAVDDEAREAPLEATIDTEPVEQAPSTPLAPITQLVGPSGGELAVGAFRARVPGLQESTEVTLRPLVAGALNPPRPPSAILAAAELTPAHLVTDSMMSLTFPVDPALDSDLTLQLLAYSRSMDTFAVVDENRPSADGTVTFRTDLMTQYAVIARPVLRVTSCIGGPFRLDQREPSRGEQTVVGRVEVEDRIAPDLAAAVLTDMRYLPGGESIVFKNEERRQSRGDEPPPHEGEDFLVDPRLARPLIELGQGVLEQWVDPVGGGPAFQLRVTDAYDGQIEHSRLSNHYRGLAVDLTLSPVPSGDRATRQQMYGWLSRQAVCAGFEFVHFENRFHVHASSRGSRLAWIEEGPEGRSLVLSRADGSGRQTLHEELGLVLEDRDYRLMDFDESGRHIELYGHHKGTPEAWRIDLDSLGADRIPYPAGGIERRPLAYVDASLRFEREPDGLVLARPSPPSEGSERGSWRADIAPFALTPDGIRGIVSASWSAGGLPLQSAPLGELNP